MISVCKVIFNVKQLKSQELSGGPRDKIIEARDLSLVAESIQNVYKT